MIDALCKEIKLQKNYLDGEPINTIYFGGGTPSLLEQGQIASLLGTIHDHYAVASDTEVTLEANPDDLSYDKLKSLHQAGVNRLSIGIQTFNEQSLIYLNRAHNQRQAYECLHNAREVGFSNISIDLIYAIPASGHDIWIADLEEALKIHPEHISSYCLTIEPQTAFGQWLKKGNMPPIDEEFSAQQFEILMQTLDQAGYEQYEVSNFCLPGFYSRHNSGYWQQKKYLGIGPSAHSYNGVMRQYNISNNPKYLRQIATGEVPYESDILDVNDMINEYLLTTLRTKWGADLSRIKESWDYDLQSDQQLYINQLMNKKYAVVEDGHLRLTRAGLLLADQISSDLFVINI